MALHWNLEDCRDVDALKADTPEGWPVTDCTIWLAMIVGLPTITAENAETFWHRVSAWEAIQGPINTSGRRMEPADIVRRIGLRTNASRMTDAAWRKKIAGALMDQSAAAWRRTKGGTLTRAEIDAGTTPA